jgi:RNA polymerase sigma factor (sigma-70 family)
MPSSDPAASALIAERITTLTPRLRRICYASAGTHSEHTPEDLYQHVCLKLLENPAKFANQPDQFILNFAVWRARGLAEKGRVYTRYVDEEPYIQADDGEQISLIELLVDTGDPIPEAVCISHETVDAIVQALESITDPGDRKMVQMLLAGENGAQIAVAMQVTRQAVSLRRRRVIRRVQEAIAA